MAALQLKARLKYSENAFIGIALCHVCWQRLILGELHEFCSHAGKLRLALSCLNIVLSASLPFHYQWLNCTPFGWFMDTSVEIPLKVQHWIFCLDQKSGFVCNGKNCWALPVNYSYWNGNRCIFELFQKVLTVYHLIGASHHCPWFDYVKCSTISVKAA